jgi:hypothetical protein
VPCGGVRPTDGNGHSPHPRREPLEKFYDVTDELNATFTTRSEKSLLNLEAPADGSEPAPGQFVFTHSSARSLAIGADDLAEVDAWFADREREAVVFWAGLIAVAELAAEIGLDDIAEAMRQNPARRAEAA